MGLQKAAQEWGHPILNCKHFLGDTLFEMVNGERKAIVQFKVCTSGQPCQIWQPVKVIKQVTFDMSPSRLGML